MPNHCTNTLIVSGKDKESVDEFVSTVNRIPEDWTQNRREIESFGKDKPNTEKVILDFGATVPFTRHKHKSYQDFGYDWQIKNWGTKWNAYETFVQQIDDTNVQYGFDTAWSPPEAWLQVTALKFPKLRFTLKYEEEGMGYFGYLQVEAPQILKEACMHTSTYSFVKKHMTKEQEKEYALLSEDESWDFIDEIKYDILEEHFYGEVEATEDINTEVY